MKGITIISSNYTLTLKESLILEMVKYCELNDIDFSDFVNRILQKGFTAEKFGLRPQISNSSDNDSKSKDVTPEDIKDNTEKVMEEHKEPTQTDETEASIVNNINIKTVDDDEDEELSETEHVVRKTRRKLKRI